MTGKKIICTKLFNLIEYQPSDSRSVYTNIMKDNLSNLSIIYTHAENASFKCNIHKIFENISARSRNMKFRNLEICLALCLLPYETFVFHFCTALSTNFIISQNLRARNFGKLLTDSFLNVSIFASFPVKSELQCLFECVVESGCKSYNYGRPSNAVTTQCLLSSTDRFAGRENLTRLVGFNHRGITVRGYQNTKASVSAFYRVGHN